jgi:thymidylate synthase ThyX
LILPERNIAGDIKISEIMELVEPVYPNETTVSMFLSGSRGWSHEQVRHRENISQRSTRYVDENESPWVRHPLIEAYLTEKEKEGYENDALLGHYVDGKMQMPWAGTAIEQCRRTYSETVDRLQQWLLSKGVDKLTARKQARGAARGYLGNALRTEMIFTTSVDGWKEIIRQRLNAAADAEIRCLYGMVLDELKKSRYASEFDKFMTVPASDGLGVVLKEIS